MNKLFLFIFLALAHNGFSQCPFPVSLDSTGNCLNTTLTVNTASPISQIIWYNANTAVDTVPFKYYSSKIIAGGNGQANAANQFGFPDGIFVDANGNVYVSDVTNSRVQKFAPGSANGITVAGGNGLGANANQLNSPRGLYVDAAGNIYVADQNNNRIQVWAPGAASGVTVAGGNGQGAAANQLNSPIGINLDANGNLYIADQFNNRVQKWASGSVTGVTVAGGNGPGSAANQLSQPSGVAVDANGNVYVADEVNNRVQKWSPGAINGITVAGGNGQGYAANQLFTPNQVFVDLLGNVYVVDFGNNRIQEWMPGSTSGVTVAGGSLINSNSGNFSIPNDVFVDATGNIFVTLDGDYSVQEWSSASNPAFLKTYSPAATGPGIYSALVTDIYGCAVRTNSATIYSSGNPTVNISSSSATISSCSTITFTANSTNSGTSPLYKWQVNGVQSGNNSPTFTNNNWHNGDVVSCVMTSNSPCAINTTAISNSVSITVNNQSSVTLGSKGSLCTGDTLFVSSNDPASKIIWYNGAVSVDTVLGINAVSTGTTVAGGNGQGNGANQFYSAANVFVDSYGNLYVADNNNARIQKFSSGSTTATNGITVAGGNGQGSGANQFNQPNKSFVDVNGNLYVADEGNDRIQEWMPGATSGITVAGGNGTGSAANQFNGANSVYVDVNGNIYVADYRNNRIQKWAPGAASGITVAGGNGQGAAANQLNQPGSIYVDGNGNIYIADFMNNRVQKWAPGATSGVTVAGGNGAGGAANQLNGPIDIVLDGNGNLYIADLNNSRIQKWAPGATSGITVAGGNGSGSAANQLNGPVGVCVDANGSIYVADWSNYRVQKWVQQTIIDTTYKPINAGTYTAVITNNSGCTITTNPVIISPTVKPSIAITSSVAGSCAGILITFTATAVNGGNAPIYQWQVNGKNVGTNNPTYAVDTLSNGAKITCILISNMPCVSTSSDTSNNIVISVNAPVTPSVSITASNTNICSGASVTFTATAVNGGTMPYYQWQINGINAGTNGPSFISSSLANNDVVTCTLTSSAACTTTATANSNDIAITVNMVTSSVTIASSSDAICSGDPITFTSAVMNGGANVSYQWQVNSINAGTDSPAYTTNKLVNGDTIKCIIKSNAVCSFAISNSIVLIVYNTPFVSPETVSVTPGQSITLNPTITGNVISYLWTPSLYLSDSTIKNPIATPTQTTAYKLNVISSDGCKASGDIIVKVLTQISVPNAFTPNGDGHNDIFYILGGQQGSIIKGFSVFNRWGQLVFQAKDILSDDPGFGWNGNYKGMPAPTGSYVYIITVALANGTKQILKGTVELIR